MEPCVLNSFSSIVATISYNFKVNYRDEKGKKLRESILLIESNHMFRILGTIV